MNDFSREQPIVPAEMAKAEAMLTPEQRVMSRVRANILAPLNYVELPEDQVKIIQDYSEKASAVARSEFERLQKESPAKKLVDALTNEQSVAAGNKEQQKLIEGAILTVKSQVKEWQDDVSEAQGLAAIKKETKPLEQIVVDQISVAEQQVSDRVPWNERRGIRPNIGVLITDWLKSGENIKERMATAGTTERVLKKLGFLPEEASMKSLFALPDPASGKTFTDSELEQLRWGNKPVKVGWDKVTGLQSESMPGVAAQVENFGGDRALLWFSFKPEAVTRSVAKIPAVAVT